MMMMMMMMMMIMSLSTGMRRYNTNNFELASYFSFQLVIHDWFNKGRGMCYPVCGMVHIKEPLMLIEKSNPYGGSGFPLSLFVWSFTICLTPYNHE